MGLFDGFLDKMKLTGNEDEDDEREEYEDEDDMDEVSSVRKPRQRRSRDNEDIFTESSSRDDDEEDEIPSRTQRSTRPAKQSRTVSNKVVSMQRTSKGSSMEVCVIKPTNVEDGREISDTLLSGRAVVLNLEGLDVELAQRIIDFTSGACYSIRGNLQKISNYIFIITPDTVDISGDFQELVNSDFSFTNGSKF